MPPPDRPLAGRRVLVVRAPERGRALAERLMALGAAVDVRAAFVVGPPADPEPARRAVLELAGYDWIVLTSVSGVEALGARLSELRRAGADGYRVAAIGKGTARAARARGFEVSLVAHDSRSEGLAAELGGRLAPAARVLVVRPEHARGVVERELARGGARVDAVAFYRTLPAPDVEALAHDVARARYDVIVLASPSALERLRETAAGAAALAGLAHARLVAIGPVTAAALRAAGLAAAAVAERPEAGAVAAAVLSVALR